MMIFPVAHFMSLNIIIQGSINYNAGVSDIIEYIKILLI